MTGEKFEEMDMHMKYDLENFGIITEHYEKYAMFNTRSDGKHCESSA